MNYLLSFNVYQLHDVKAEARKMALSTGVANKSTISSFFKTSTWPFAIAFVWSGQYIFLPNFDTQDASKNEKYFRKKDIERRVTILPMHYPTLLRENYLSYDGNNAKGSLITWYIQLLSMIKRVFREFWRTMCILSKKSEFFRLGWIFSVIFRCLFTYSLITDSLCNLCYFKESRSISILCDKSNSPSKNWFIIIKCIRKITSGQ